MPTPDQSDIVTAEHGRSPVGSSDLGRVAATCPSDTPRAPRRDERGEGVISTAIAVVS